MEAHQYSPVGPRAWIYYYCLIRNYLPGSILRFPIFMSDRWTGYKNGQVFTSSYSLIIAISCMLLTIHIFLHLFIFLSLSYKIFHIVALKNIVKPKVKLQNRYIFSCIQLASPCTTMGNCDLSVASCATHTHTHTHTHSLTHSLTLTHTM